MYRTNEISCSDPACSHCKKMIIHKEPKNQSIHVCSCCKKNHGTTLIKIQFLFKLKTKDKGGISLVYCTELLNSLLPEHDSKETISFFKQPFEFNNNRSNQDILESLAEGFLHIYDMTQYSKKGKHARICKWHVNGLSNNSGYKKDTYVRVATIVFREYEIYTECYDTLKIRECHTLAIINEN